MTKRVCRPRSRRFRQKVRSSSDSRPYGKTSYGLSAKNKIFRELTLKEPVLLQRAALLTLTLTLVTRLLGLNRPFVVGDVAGISLHRKLISVVRDRAVLDSVDSTAKEFFRPDKPSASCARCSPQRVVIDDRHKLKAKLSSLARGVCDRVARLSVGPIGLAVIRPFCFSVRHA